MARSAAELAVAPEPAQQMFVVYPLGSRQPGEPGRSGADPLVIKIEELDERYVMNDRDLFQIGDVPGFTPQIGRLISMMNYTRYTTLSAVEGLEVDELDYLPDPQSNSIGALLSHIAAAEVGYQAATFSARDLNEEERHEWGAALDLSERARREIRGHELEYYLSRLEQVRAKTLAELSRRQDQWLEEHTSFGSGQRVNNYFKWFHVFGHELNHRGQIRWLRRHATKTS